MAVHPAGVGAHGGDRQGEGDQDRLGGLDLSHLGVQAAGAEVLVADHGVHQVPSDVGDGQDESLAHVMRADRIDDVHRLLDGLVAHLRERAQQQQLELFQRVLLELTPQLLDPQFRLHRLPSLTFVNIALP